MTPPPLGLARAQKITAVDRRNLEMAFEEEKVAAAREKNIWATVLSLPPHDHWV
jgi:hypothetical protein